MMTLPACGLASLVSLAMLVAPGPRCACAARLAWSAPDTVIWKYAAGEDVVFVRLTPLGSVVVSMRDRLIALDPATGQPIWTRQDIRDVADGAFETIPLTPYGIVRTRNGIAVLDLETGATAWDSTAVPLTNVRGYFYVPEQRMLLLYGRGRPDGKALVAMGVDSGKVRWEQRALLEHEPELWDVDGVQSLSGHQPPLADTDSTLILYVSKDGPFKIRAATGQLIWRVADLKGEDPPTLAQAYPPMTLAPGLLLVPYERKLMAVDPRDGRVVWSGAKNFKSPLSQMQPTATGVVVRGARPLDQKKTISMPDAFLDYLDLREGKSAWTKPFMDMKDESIAPFLIVGDTVYFGDHERLYAVALQDGASRERLSYDFEGGEEPVTAERQGDQLILLSSHNLLLFSTRDGQSIHKHYPAPGTSFVSKLGKAALFTLSAMSQAGAVEQQGRPGAHFTVTFDYNPFIVERMRGTVRAFENYTFMYTKAPDRAGREGFSLVRVRKGDGQEAGRLWFDDRSPEYVLDAAAGAVYWKRGSREIVAMKFAEP